MWVLAAAAEDSWHLHAAIANLLQVAVEEGVSEFCFNLLLGILLDLLLLRSPSIASFLSLLDLLFDLTEVKLFQ